MMTDLFLSVAGISISVSLIVISLILTAPLLNKRYAVKWKYFIWIFLALRMLIPYSGDEISAMVHRPVSHAIPGDRQGENVPGPGSLQAGEPRQWITVELPRQMGDPVILSSESNGREITPLDILAFAWLGGCICIAVFYLSAYIRYRIHLKSGGKPVEESAVLEQLQQLLDEMQIKQTLRVLEYAGAVSPMIIGFARPVLVLPGDHYNTEELYFILKHELVHLKRHDIYLKLLLLAANTVHWFNPVIWLMRKEAVVDMELSCDERVVQGAGFAERKAYTETMLSALHRNCGKRAALSTQFYGGKQVMKRRFKNILRRMNKKNGFLLLLCAIVLTVSLGILVGCSVMNSDQVPTGDGTSDAGRVLTGDGGPDAEGRILAGDGTSDADRVLAGNDEPDGDSALAGNGEMSIMVPEDSQEVMNSLFWNPDNVQDTKEANVITFSTGLQLCLPAGWRNRAVMAVETEGGRIERLVLSTKDKTEEGIREVLFYLSFVSKEGYDADDPYSIYGRETDRVLGTYRRDGEEYALIFEIPRLYYMGAGPAFQELVADNQDLFESIGEVRIVTDNMQDFTECSLDDLDWIKSWKAVIDELN